MRDECAFDGCPRVPYNRHKHCSGHEKQKARGVPLQPLKGAPVLSPHRPEWSQAEKDELTRLYHAGKSKEAIARAMGRPLATIRGRIAKYNSQRIAQRMGDEAPGRPLVPYPGVERCRCGLALPCGSCLPTITELAASRRGDAAGMVR